ncbi:unnamed protein product [Victoria cruziana]
MKKADISHEEVPGKA